MALGEAAGNQQAGDNAESSKWWVKITGPKRLIDSAATKLCEAWKKDGECRHPFVKSQCGAVCASSVAEGAESDPGAPARCDAVQAVQCAACAQSGGCRKPCTTETGCKACPGKPGLKKCPIGKMNTEWHRRNPSTYAASCPDGIGWQGVYFDHHLKGGFCQPWTSTIAATSGVVRCERHTCLDAKTGKPGKTRSWAKSGWRKHVKLCSKPGISPFKGVCDESYCDTSGAPQVCQKMQVLHVNHMSRSAGVLVVKRSSCGSDGKCSVFKTGLCIDLRTDVWSSIYNHHPFAMSISDARGGMIEQAKAFGKKAAALLKKHNNRLPERYACSNTRHDWKYQKKRRGKPTQGGKWYCPHGCKKINDATLASAAILNF